MRTLILGVTLCFFQMSVTMAGETNDSTAYRTIIDGATQPEQVSDVTKYAMFVKRYSIDIRDHLLQKLSVQDDAILNALAVQDEAAEHDDNELFNRDRLSLCTQRRSKNAVALAQEHQRIVENFYNRRLSRYSQKLDALSSNGRNVVEEFVAHVIVPNTKTEEVDYVIWATIDPEGYLFHVEIQCHIAETGELPPEAQKAIDEKVRELKQQRNSESEK